MVRTTVTVLVMSLSLWGCDGAEAPTPPPEKPTPTLQADAHGGEHGAHNSADAVPGAVKAPANGKVFFTSPADGATVSSPVSVVMGVEGLAVEPAGELKAGTGHHHIIVDGQGIALGEGVPKDDTHIHFGGGQTETELALSPGKHTLTLQFADGLHRSYGPTMSATIQIVVSE